MTDLKGKRYRDNGYPQRVLTVLTEPTPEGVLQVRYGRYDAYWMPVEALDMFYTEVLSGE